MKCIALALAFFFLRILDLGAVTLEIGVLTDLDKKAEVRYWDDFSASIGDQLQGINVRFSVMSREELDDAVARRAVDLLITDPAHRAVLARRAGVGSSLLAVTPIDRGQVLTSAAGAIVIRQGLLSEIEISSRQDLRYVASERESLVGYQAQMLRLKDLIPPLIFDAIRVKFVGGSPASAVNYLTSGDADVALIPAGTIETLRGVRPQDFNDLIVVFRLDRSGFPYASSTPLYPVRGLYPTPDADDAHVKALISVLLRQSGTAALATYPRAYGFSLPRNEEVARRVAFELREPPYDTEPPISFLLIWRDHRFFVLALAVVFSAFVFALALSLWLSLNFRRQRRLAISGQATLTRLLETLPDIVYFKDREGRYRLANRKFASFLGRAPESVVAKGDSDLFDIDTARLIEAGDARALSHGSEQSYEETIISPIDRQPRIFLTTKTPVRDSEGLSTGVLGVSRDITGMRRIESALSSKVREQQLLNKLLKLTQDIHRPISSTLPDLATLVLDIIGSSQTTRVKISWDGTVAAKGAESAKTPEISRKLEVSGFGSGELTVYVSEISPDNISLGFASLDPVLIEGITSTLQSFFERIAQEDRRAKIGVQLRKSEAIFRSLMENTPLPVLLSTDAGFVAANPAAVRLLGYTRESDIVGKTALDISPAVLSDGRIAKIAVPAILEIPQSGRSHQFEWEYLRADGTTIPVEVTLTPIVIGEIHYRHVVWTDLTARKHAEQELENQRRLLDRLVHERTEEIAKAKQEAEAASASKSAFLANMSHEMRTPLNAIMGFAHLIRSEAQLSRDADRAGKIVSASEHLLSLINDILDSSKIEAGMLKLETQPFSVGDALRGVVGVLVERAEGKGLRIELEIDSSLDHLWVKGDDLRFRQILFNIVGNAIKFTEHGFIRVSAAAINEASGRIAISTKVSDSGVGISSEAIERLFMPFEQAEVTTTRRFGGSGLGLAISRRLARMMGGDLEVRSVLGSGSEFTIRIVCEAAAAVENQIRLPISGKPQVSPGTRVLLAEDNDLNRALASEVLDSLGVEVVAAVNGREAVEKARSVLPHLILMDMQMPEMDGIAATREILRQPWGAGIPIVAMTANAFDDDRRRCLAAGMVDFVTKPLTPNNLAKVVVEWSLTSRSPNPRSGRHSATPADEKLENASHPVVFDRSAIGRNFTGHDAFVRISSTFIQNNDAFNSELNLEIERGDWVAVAKALHARKPIIIALGADEYAAALMELESSIRRDAPNKETLAAAFFAAGQKFFDVLSAYLMSFQVTRPPSRASETVDLVELRPLLAAGDIRAKMAFAKIADALRNQYGEAAFREISSAVNKYDFPAALRLVEAL